MGTDENVDTDPEIAAISIVYGALKGLEKESQIRVLEYVAAKVGSRLSTDASGSAREKYSEGMADAKPAKDPEHSKSDETDEFEGISPVAKKWISRNDLGAKSLSKIFSLGVDEIDLVSKTVPGANKKEKMRNVFLLKGAAAYLGTGAARFSHEQVKEACLHYDAFDVGNFARYFGSLAAEVAGNKESGYTLTARGLNNATELIKQMAPAT
jgi:hypothetical protein